MRRAAQVDRNQEAVTKYLEGIGMSVQSLAAVGQGVPDLLVGFRGVNALVEVKNPEQKPSDRTLTPDQSRWHAKWAGQIIVALTGEQAAEAIIKLSEIR